MTEQPLFALHYIGQRVRVMIDRPPGLTLDDAQFRALTHFQERWFSSTVLR